MSIASPIVTEPAPNVTHTRKIQDEPKREPNFLDGCAHVYLDVGTNVGVQIRKLYEPFRFKTWSGGLAPIFRRYYNNSKFVQSLN